MDQFSGGSWSTAANWSPNQVPGAGDSAYITNNGNYTVTISSTVTASLVRVGGTSGTQQLSLSNGTISGSALNFTNGASLIVSRGTLDGVTVDGNLDVGNLNDGAIVTVLNGLVLNGTLYLGNPTNSSDGHVNFSGSQTLGGSGTVVLDGGSGSCNALRLTSGGTTLTIAPGITVRGQSGAIGYSPCWQGPSSVAVVNQGTIMPDVSGGTISIYAQRFTNQASVQVISNAGLYINTLQNSASGTVLVNNGTLTLDGSWANAGEINVTNSTVNLDGSFSLGSLGVFNRSGGTVNLAGTLDNAGGAMTLNTGTGSWVMNGGTLRNTVLTETVGAQLIFGSGTLDGVTVEGNLDVGNLNDGAIVTVLNGLVLNGTLYLGNPTNPSDGHVNFSGSQTLDGSGTVVLGGRGGSCNALRLTSGGTTLTIGSGITVRGQSGAIGYSPCWQGPSSVAVVNQGTIMPDVSGGTISIYGNSFQNSGTIGAANNGTLQIPQNSLNQGNIAALSGGFVNIPATLYLNGFNYINSQPGSTIQTTAGLIGNTVNLGQFIPLGTSTFNGSGTAASPQLLEVMGRDLETSQLGFIHNFNYGTITLANNTYVKLVDQNHNSSGSGAEALYVNSLVVPSGNTLDLNGLHAYARATQISGTVLNGTVAQIPNSGTIGFANPTLGNIAMSGQLDQWTFFGRAGQVYTVLVDPGTGSGVPPYLNLVEATVMNTNGVVLATGTNSSSGTPVLLSNIAITNDGNYGIQVYASPVSPNRTGHYMVTIWQTTPNVMPLPLGQVVSGSIRSPYSLDQWTFGAVSNSLVRFHLVNLSGAGVGFDLTGPNGWIGFTNLTADSSFITLPASGNYSVLAHSLNGQYGAIYAFQLNSAAITNLNLGAPFTGQFAASGQGQLCLLNIPVSAPLQVILNNLVPGNHAVIYASLGHPPTPTSFEFSATASGPNQLLLIPVATAGAWFVLVYADNIQTAGDYTVTASSASVLLSSVTPERTGANAPGTFTLVGAGFDSSSSVQFIKGANAYPATSISVDSFTQITVNQTAGTLPPGIYSLRVAINGSSATLTNSLQVLSSGAPNLVTSVILPSQIGYHAPATIYPNFANTGDAAMPAPLLTLTASQDGVQGAFLTLDGSLVARGLWTSASPKGFYHSVQFLGAGQTPGVLQPGDSSQIPVYYAGWQKPWDLSHPPANWNLGVIKADDTTPVDWASLQTSMQPSTSATEAWNAIFSSFTNQVGSTWGAYVTMLDNNASYLGRLGLNVSDISKLLSFQFMQADGLGPLRTLANSVDASVPTPSLPLIFSRSFGEPISQRYSTGPLGRGWSHNWQYSLTQGSDGTITIFGPGKSQRIFQPDTRGGYFAQAGDFATIAPASSGAFTLTEKTGLLYYYRSDGTLDYMEDLNYNRITLGYNSGRLTSLTHSSGQNIQIAYNGGGLIQTVTDSVGRQTVLTYDGANEHLTGAQYADGRTASYTYNTGGSPALLHALTAAASSCCNWRYFAYDSLGRLSGTYLAGNTEELTFSYGTGGQVTVSDGLGYQTQFFYDHRGMLLKTVDANGNVLRLNFDQNYNPTSLTDPAGRSYNYTYDSRGNLIRSLDPLGNTSQFSFTSDFNRLATVTDAKGNLTRYAYDPYGNLQSITYADNSVENWTYDFDGNPQTWENRRGHQTFYTVNNNAQVTGKYFADNSATSYAYDSRGNLTDTTTYNSILTPLESVSMTCDASNHLARMDYPGGKFLTFTYDSNGRRLSSVDQLGHALHYTYDAGGRLQSMTNELNALVVLYQYDAAGRIVRKTIGNGMFTTYQNDPAGQPLNLTNFLADSTVLSRFNFTYDSRGRRTTMGTVDGNWTYAYDDLGQLTRAVYAAATTNIPHQDLTYVYDAVGNRTLTIENGVTNSYAVNNLNEYFSAGQTNLTFDADGNLIREAWPGGTNTYPYNDENTLIGVGTAQGTWSYGYDGLGNRVARTENGVTTRFVIDPTGLGNVVGEYTPAGSLVAHYDHARGLLARVDPIGNSAGYAFDAIGNAQQLVSSLGAVLNTYAYAPFGGSLRNVETVPNPFQFGGELGVLKAEAGLSLMRARYYGARLGRFASQDPLGFGGKDINLYRFAQNQPTLQVDPNGLEWDQSDRYGDGNGEKAAILGCIVAREIAGLQVCGELHGFDKPAPAPIWKRGPTPPPLTPAPAPIPTATPIPPAPPTPPGSSGSTPVTRPIDPNQLTGPSGYGADGFVFASKVLAYRIDFENQTNATAPAQQVIITDPLSANYDWSTFNVTEVGFGDVLISLPPGSSSFAQNVPYSYLGTNFEVQIQISINPNTGLITATFRTIDPNTSLPPPVNIGFLPRENGTGRGQGHVSYTIRGKSGLATGTQLRNVALISFDNQPSISTDQIDPNNPAAGTDPNRQALITLDAVAPTSHLNSLPAQSQLLQVPVSWTGQDDVGGSGIASYDIHVSDNGGAWTLWQSAAIGTNATFQGKPQHTYAFKSIAHDNAGNVEAHHAAADTSTWIIANPQFLLSVTPTMTNLNDGATFSYTVTVKNIGTLNLNNVVMSNRMPPGISLDWVQYGHGGATIGDNSIVWVLGNLNTNVAASMNITADTVSNGAWTNLFVVADSDGAASANNIQLLYIGGTPPALLNIALTNDHQVVLSWESDAGSFSLQTKSDLVTQVDWKDVTSQSTTNGRTISVTFPVAGTNQFFRLRGR